ASPSANSAMSLLRMLPVNQDIPELPDPPPESGGTRTKQRGSGNILQQLCAIAVRARFRQSTTVHHHRGLSGRDKVHARAH
ncbi:MAG TPA: hypothetical protein VFV84_10160, partial [Burkholderiales bacterium]|nr:hypothetical protein [Burkholderiales bacterium]